MATAGKCANLCSQLARAHRPKMLEVDRETLTPTYGRFFLRAAGAWVWHDPRNGLRRVLLSSPGRSDLRGVKIEGAARVSDPARTLSKMRHRHRP